MMISARKFWLSVSVLGMLFVSAPHDAQAARFTGKYLLDLCDFDAAGNEKLPGGHAACQGYISGVLDYHSFLQGLKLAPKTDICVPDSVSMNQIHAIVLKYLKTNKQHDGFIASPAVTMALFQAYPCRRK
jgi:hypothetical protein